VEVDAKRIGTLVFGKPLLRDREEEEVRGYRNALSEIHERSVSLAVSEKAIKQLHALTRGDFWDAGVYKAQPSDIIEKLPDGRSRIRFRTVPPDLTAPYMDELVRLWEAGLRERWLPPPILLAAFNLDFLCIHPFRDGNGRVSRLLLLLQTYHCGMEVGRYISLERLIEKHKEGYYESLRRSSENWHEGKHDPWPYIHFLLATLREAYQELERRVGETVSPRGAKAEQIRQAILKFETEFRLIDVEQRCPGVGRDWIRRVLSQLRKEGTLACTGKGPAARWRRNQ